MNRGTVPPFHKMNQGTVPRFTPSPPPFHLWDRCDRIIVNRKDIIMAIAGVVQKTGLKWNIVNLEAAIRYLSFSAR